MLKNGYAYKTNFEVELIVRKEFLKKQQYQCLVEISDLVFVNVDVTQMGVEQQLVGFHVDWGLSPTLVAQAPLGVDSTPVLWT